MAALVSLSRANTLRLSQAAGLCARLLCLPSHCFAAQLAQFALKQPQSWVREVLDELSLLGVPHPHAYGIHLGSPATSIKPWLRTVNTLLTRHADRHYASLLQECSSFQQYACWQPSPALQRAVYGPAVATHRARYWGLARLGHHPFADGHAARHRALSTSLINCPCRFCARSVDSLAHALFDCPAHNVFFSHTILRPVRARSQCSCKLRAYGALEAAASVPARIGEDLMQIRHGPLAQLGGRGQLEQRRRVGALSRDREHTGPSRDPGGDGGGLHVSGDRRHAMACEEAQELHCFGAEPAADLDADHNESTAPRALEFRVGLEALAPCSGRHCASRLHVGARVGFAASGEGETMVASSASCEPCQRGRPLATTSMRRSSETGTSRFMSASRTWRATLAPASRHTRATACSRGQRAGGQNARGSTGRAVVTERVQYPVAAASARCEREGQAQAPQQQDPELRTGDGDIIAGGQEVQGAGSEGPCLGQQQRTGRRGEVRKMRLVRALIACTGSRTLPAPERPRVVISVWCRGRGGTGANDCPVRCLVPKVA